MSQHDFNIANQTFPSFRSDLNDALQAAATVSAGATAPTTPYAYQLWFDTSTNTYKARNAGNSAWISLFGNDLTNGGITFGDNDKAVFGAGSDLQIYSDGSNSYIQEGSGTSGIRITTDNQLLIRKHDSENIAAFNVDGAVRLYYDNAEKIATTSSGCDITGTVTADGLTVDGTGGQITTDNNGFITSKQSLDVATAGGRFIGKSNRGELGHIAIEQTATGADGGYIRFSISPSGSTSPTERMRIDSSGNLLVGKTASNVAAEGAEIRSSGFTGLTVDGGAGLTIRRLTSDGELQSFFKDTTKVGSIEASGGKLTINSQGSNLSYATGGVVRMNNDSSQFYPQTDNSMNLGIGSLRWNTLFASNGTINTSDANEKQQITSLTDAEITAAKAISALFKTYKWNDAVAAKGDAARTHTGVIAQDVEAAMTAAGLDAADYAFWCSDTWWETQTEVSAVEADEENGIEAVAAYTRTDTFKTAEEAPEGATERTRMGIRYPELLAFVGAATEQRLANIETRLAALEA